MKKKVFSGLVLLLSAMVALGGCGQQANEEEGETGNEPVTIMVAAAASLENALVNDLIPLFREKYDYITVEGTYDSSGKLQTQIEEGLAADIFMSAAMKQMDALTDAGLVDAASVSTLLVNKIVLIEPAGAAKLVAFEDIAQADAIAIGDPESVPAGQYAKEALTALGLWDQVAAKASFGTNVTEVLNWVAEGSADAGVVYSTDAQFNDKVAVVAEAPEDSLETRIIYPIGMVKASAHADAAQLFLDFLASDDALAVFQQYGFTINRTS